MKHKEICGQYASSNPADNRQGCCGVCLNFNYSSRNCDNKAAVIEWSISRTQKEPVFL